MSNLQDLSSTSGSMLPVLSNGIQLPDNDDIEAVGVITQYKHNRRLYVRVHMKTGVQNRINFQNYATAKMRYEAYDSELDCTVEDSEEDEDIHAMVDLEEEPDANTESGLQEIEPTTLPSQHSATLRGAYEAYPSNLPQRSVPNKIHRISLRHVATILTHLIALLADRDTCTIVSGNDNIYTPLITKLGEVRVRSILTEALDNDVKVMFQGGILELPVLQSLDNSRPLNYSWPGIYLHVIHSTIHHNVYWLYVGAALDVSTRIKQHYQFRYTPSRLCLHYHIWNHNPANKDFFVLLAGMKGHSLKEDELVPLLNLLEHWNCLIWQTYPSAQLLQNLPYGVSICNPNIHLNRASALRQKYNVKGKRTSGNVDTAKELQIGTEDLLESSDPEIRNYFLRNGGHYDLPMWRKLEGIKLGKAIQAETYFQAATQAMRKRDTYNKNNVTREAEHAKGDVTIVWIRCSFCKHPNTQRIDPAPIYEIATGFYVCRRLACRYCPAVTGKEGRCAGSRESITEPLDRRIAEYSTTQEKLRRKYLKAEI